MKVNDELLNCFCCNTEAHLKVCFDYEVVFCPECGLQIKVDLFSNDLRKGRAVQLWNTRSMGVCHSNEEFINKSMKINNDI